MGDLGSITGLGRSPGEWKGNPLQYSGLENSMDSVHGVTKSQTRLDDFHFHFTKTVKEKGICILIVPSLFTASLKRHNFSGHE